MRWIRWRNLPNDQKIVQHPHRSELLLYGRFGAWKVLDPGGHMERSHGREFQAVSSAPIKKLSASPRVGLSRVAVADCGGEKVDVSFGDFGTGRSNQLREPGFGRSAGHDREFSFGNRFHKGPLLYHIKDVMCYSREQTKGNKIVRVS